VPTANTGQERQILRRADPRVPGGQVRILSHVSNPVQVPSGTITLLFTDVEGSTRLWEAEPDLMAQALRRHDEILRDAIGQVDGYVFKTVGDAFCAAFSTAQAALTAALRGQRDLAAESWPIRRPIRARMGLHTGICEERDGDYFGPAVNRTARLVVIAHGGQVLVSRATAELLSHTLADDVRLRDLGTLRLKDLGRPEQVFQVEASFLQRDFPTLASAANGGTELTAGLPGTVATRSDVRASHADRDWVVEQLRIAAGDGRLTAEELDQRLEAALTARTYNELAVLTTDLPAVANPGGLVPAQSPEPKDLVRIQCSSGTSKRDGQWVVPQRMEVGVASGTVKLDFTDAVITDPVMRLAATVNSGTLIFVTRPGIVVDVDDIVVGSGTVKVRRHRGPAVPRALRVEVTGKVGSGTVVVRSRRRTFLQWLVRRPAV